MWDQNLSLRRLQSGDSGNWGRNDTVTNLLLLNNCTNALQMHMGCSVYGCTHKQRPEKEKHSLPSYVCSHMMLKYTTVVLNNKQLQFFFSVKQKHEHHKEMFILHYFKFACFYFVNRNPKYHSTSLLLFSPLKHKSVTQEYKEWG